MTTPLWILLAFAVWTLLVLLAGVGVHRWSRILFRRAELTDFPGGVVEGTPSIGASPGPMPIASRTFPSTLLLP